MNEILVNLMGPPKGYLSIHEIDGIRISQISASNYGAELTEQDCIELINQYHPTAIDIENALGRDFIFDFEKLTHPSSIENLSLALDTGIEVKNLEKLENLQGLYLTRDSFLNIDYSKLMKLKRLSITYNPKNTTWMNSKSIENLGLHKCGKHRDLRFLSDMESLQIVDVLNLPVRTLSGLEKLPKLKALSIEGLKKLEDYEEIASLTNLEYLRILKPPDNINFDFLVKLKKLRWLWLDPFKITFNRDDELPNLVQFPGSTKNKSLNPPGADRIRPFNRDWYRNGHEFFPDRA